MLLPLYDDCNDRRYGQISDFKNVPIASYGDDIMFTFGKVTRPF